MCKWLRPFLLILLLACFLKAQNPAKEGAVKPAPPAVDNATEALVYEGMVTKVTLESNGIGSREQTVRVRVQSDAGVKQAGVLTFPYESYSTTIEIPYVRVRKPDGSVVDTPTENILDMPADITREAPFYSDLHEKQVAVKGLGQGDVLEYQCRWQSTKALIPGQFWFDYRFSKDAIVLNEELDIRISSQRVIKLKSPAYKPEISEKDGYKTYHWKTSHLENGKKEENGEQIWQMSRGRFPQPDVRLTSFQSWDEIGRWYSGLQQERVKPSAEVQAKAAELTKGLTSDDEKLHALYNYVSTRFRYIGVAFGIGRYQPHAADEVLGNQYGDCKDKHTLFASLLSASGIKAYPALISSSHDLDSDAPTPSQFDHVISAVPRGDGYIWLDTTPEVAPYGLIMPALRDKHALVIPEAGVALATTMAEPPYPSSYKFHVEGKLGDDGVLKAKIEQTNRTDAEVLFRAGFRRVPQTQWKDLVQNVSRSMGFGGTVDDVEVSSPENLTDAFHFSYSYDRKDYSDWSNRRITPPLPPVPASDYGDEVKKLTAPIPLGAPGEFIYHATIELPKQYEPSLPTAVTIKRGFAEYHATYELKNHILTADRRLIIQTREVPPEKYEEYKSFVKAILEDENHFIDLTSTDNEVPLGAGLGSNGFDHLPESGNPETRGLVEQSRIAVLQQNLKEAIEKLELALAADPTAIRAQVMLGGLYLETGRQDDGLKLLQRAVAAYPKEAFLYKGLGMTLEHLKKNGEAAKLWEDYSRNFPEDVTGPTQLAGSLYRLKRYLEAAKAYESAARLDRNNAYLPMWMGMAYMRAGDKEKGLAALRKAVATDSGETVLNDVGYEMADANVNLSEALEYSQKAVQRASEESQKVDLNSLSVKDLGATVKLSMYWDTLGWVYFRMGNLDQAEKYIGASWKLDQNPTVGKHLGEIYQKKDKKEAALRMFHEALLVSSGPDGGNDEPEEIQRHIAEVENSKAKSVSPATLTELNEMRTIRMPRIIQGQASADFFLLVSPGGKIENVKFINGSDQLKSATAVISHLKIQDAFPDNTPARVVRRGILGCYPTTGCSLVFLSPRQVQSVN
jgi:tetratricopeptide (TPR) repeat protein/transglutaminase-like putative cysteine protease